MSAVENKAVFLSYASQDAAAAKNICDALRAAGVEVWFDQNELRGGDAWDQKIRRQIRECALFVPVISANTNARLEGYFRREWKVAVDRTHDMAEEKAFLVPVVVDDTSDRAASVPEKFREVQWTRLPGGAPNAAFCGRVATLLGIDRPPQPIAVTPAKVGRAAVPLAAAPRPPRWRLLVASVAAIAAILLVAGSVYQVRRLRDQTERRAAMLDEIDRRIAAQDILGAFASAEQAEHESPGDRALAARWDKIALTCSIDTEPSGAEVFLKPFREPKTQWRRLGTTPLRNVRLPRVFARWRFEKPDCAAEEITANVSPKMQAALLPAANVPAEMVHVPAASVSENSTGLPGLRLPEFLIDRYEVTNRQFKAFVDAGGYANPAFWREPFVRDGRTLPREQALAEFRDASGRPGPATWRDGSFTPGTGDLPVTGVSWFEAAAYAAWAGKRLPSVYHWRVASNVIDSESTVPLSNFSGKGLAPVGSYQGVSTYGAYDMAGNAKEWCWNSTGTDARYLLGGSWREPDYMFVQPDAASPFERGDTYGFRCVKLMGTAPLPPLVDAARAPASRDYTKEQPVSDEVFRVFRSLYAYDKTPLDSRTEGANDTDPRWREEKVSYRAAYGDERISAHLFLPKNSTPPFQTIVYFPGAGAIGRTNGELRDLNIVGVLVSSGRALLYPIYKGTYDRRDPTLNTTTMTSAPETYRDWVIMQSKDLGRSIDYLETRPDIQATNLAYAGNSWGGAMGAILPAVEPRIKVNVLIIGGFLPHHFPPEADQINFAPRNTAPTLMVSGRYDFRFPLETSQKPMFKWLGAPPDQKRHVLFDSGHALKAEQIASVAYAWLDQYQGLVK